MLIFRVHLSELCLFGMVITWTCHMRHRTHGYARRPPRGAKRNRKNAHSGLNVIRHSTLTLSNVIPHTKGLSGE